MVDHMSGDKACDKFVNCTKIANNIRAFFYYLFVCLFFPRDVSEPHIVFTACTCILCNNTYMKPCVSEQLQHGNQLQ